MKGVRSFIIVFDFRKKQVAAAKATLLIRVFNYVSDRERLIAEDREK